ncbi:MAG TPA: PfkB family carbohydrate kinase [Solirubrobacteraceae bacterium]
MSRFQYVTVGHVTVDVMSADGSRRPGGGAFYSALQAARLGLRTLIVTKGAPGELRELLAPFAHELQVQVLPAAHTTTLASSGSGSARRQRVLAWAGPMDEAFEVDTEILHLAPVARETPSRWRGRAEFIGITPQGLVREWDENGLISLVEIERERLPERYDALVVSEAEQHCLRQAPNAIAPRPGIVAITAGANPTTVVVPDGATEQVPARPAGHPREDLGAGDVFAAAFFIALHEGRSPADAAAYGNAAASVRVAGVGAGAVGDRLTIEAALTR